MSRGADRPAAALIFGLLLAVSFLEVAGRLLHDPRVFTPRRFGHRPDATFGYRCERGPSEPPRRRAALLAVGDSFTYGTDGLDKRSMYPAIAAEKLGVGWENEGCAGYGLLQEELVAAEAMPVVRPRWLVVGHLPGNDNLDDYDFSRWGPRSESVPYELYRKAATDGMGVDGAWGRVHLALVGRSAAYTVLFKAFRALSGPRHWREDPDAVRLGRAIGDGALARMQSSARAAGARLVVVLVATKPVACPGAGTDLTYAPARAALASAGIDVLDTAETLRAAAKEDCGSLFLPDSHWSRKAQRIVGEALAVRLARRKS